LIACRLDVRDERSVAACVDRARDAWAASTCSIQGQGPVSVGVARFGPMTTVPDVISRYYAAAAANDLDTLIGCFTADAHVLDEGRDYHGVSEIRTWRESVASQFSYTTEITGTKQTGDREYVVSTHLEGDFPGGVVDLDQRFTLAGELISDLSI
jgi:hypothetical protein